MTCRARSRRGSAARGGAGKKRKPGKQPGAPGAYLAWNPRPDKTEEVFPGGRCECRRDLAGAGPGGSVVSHQVIDLPEAKAESTQYDRHEEECPCGRTHAAARPAGGRVPHVDRAELPGLVRVLDGDAPRPGRTVRGHLASTVRGPPPTGGCTPCWAAPPGPWPRRTGRSGRWSSWPAWSGRRDPPPVRPRPGRRSTCTSRAPGLLTYYFLGDRDLPVLQGLRRQPPGSPAS